MEIYILEVKFEGNRDCAKCPIYDDFYEFCHANTNARSLKDCPLIKQEVKGNEN